MGSSAQEAGEDGGNSLKIFLLIKALFMSSNATVDHPSKMFCFFVQLFDAVSLSFTSSISMRLKAPHKTRTCGPHGGGFHFCVVWSGNHLDDHFIGEGGGFI